VRERSYLGVARGRLAPALALTAVLTWAVFLVSSQPVTSPWWRYADADAIYTGTALNLTYHNSHVQYLDHPGLPLHELLATSFLAERLVRSAAGEDGMSEDVFFAERMGDLDSTRWQFRGWSILFYLSGAVVSFFVAARLLGHPTWGLAGGLLWTGAPGLLAMSIQYRPDVPLAVLTLVVGYLIARGALARSAAHYLGAGLLLGFAVTVKLHAAGLVVPLALAAVWRRREQGWWPRLRRDTADFVGRRPLLAAACVVLWLVLLVTFNSSRFPFTPTDEQRSLLTNALGVLAVYFGATALINRWGTFRRLRSVFSTFYAMLTAAMALGIVLPALIVLDDGLQMLVVIWTGLGGRGVNEEIALFSAPLDQLAEFPLRQAVIVFVLAAAAAALGLVRREPAPVLLFVGAAVLAVMAQARLATTHYFAPAYVLSVPAALWLFRARGGLRAPLLLWPIVGFLLLPHYQHRHEANNAASAFESRERPALDLVDRLLERGEVALVPGGWPREDSRYFEFVRVHVEHTPEYRYRFLPDLPTALAFAAENDLRPRYFVGPVASSVEGTMPLQLVSGMYTARRLPGVPAAVELLSGPSG
jgi:hypothetical protein